MNSEVAQAPELPSRDECTMAFLAHLLQVFTGFIGPLIIFCVKQDSRFVKFHALQALIWQLCNMVIVFGCMIAFFVSAFSDVFRNGSPAPNQPPPAIFFYFPIIWLLIMGSWVANMVLGIVYGIKASRGEWAAYPLIGKRLRSRYAVATTDTPAAS